MKGFAPLILGIFGTLAFSWLGLAFVPNLQIGHLEPQADEEMTDVYPGPRSGMAERGRQIYVANGCYYCHSQQVRADYAGSDIDRKWGSRRSAPRDYIFDRPVVLGKMRMGPDLANIGKRAPVEDENAPPNASPAGSPGSSPAPAASPAASPVAGAAPASASPAATPAAPSATTTAASPPAAAPATAPSAPASSPAASAAPPKTNAAPAANAAIAGASPGGQQTIAATAGAASSADSSTNGTPPLYSAAWHHLHLYAPRSINEDSNMPSYKFLYELRRTGGETSANALRLTGSTAPQPGFEVVPTYDAKCLVAYLMSLDQSHALNEVKSTTPASPPAPGKAATK